MLPQHMWESVFDYLAPKDLVIMSSVCKRWRGNCTSDFVSFYVFTFTIAHTPASNSSSHMNFDAIVDMEQDTSKRESTAHS